MKYDPDANAHREWIGYVQPTGLVVSAAALLAAQVQINQNIIPDHQRFLSCLITDQDEKPYAIRDLREFTETVLGWQPTDLEPFPIGQLNEEFCQLEVALPEYSEVLRPSFVVRNPHRQDSESLWLLLIQQLSPNTNFDEPLEHSESSWVASPHAKFERLLRETGNPIGLLFNGSQLRLIYAPRGETSGFITFNVDEMSQVPGRAIFAALHMLLSQDSLFAGPEAQRLPAVLEASRKYQSTVSNELADQVLEALYELLRGFQSADDQLGSKLLRDVLANDPDHVYAGLLTVLMRIVFLLFAEDRDLLPNDETYGKFYSITGLFKRLREDHGRHSEIMDDRFGAWSQLLTVFRMIYHGANHAQLHVPSRKGYLFDPDRFPFLEGRTVRNEINESPIPRISDGVIYRVLDKLIMLKGERLNYRTLDVEQIGSVYEAIMGFNLEVASGPSIAIKPKKRHGAPTTINLLTLLSKKPDDRTKWFSEITDQVLPKKSAQNIRQANDIPTLLACVEPKVARRVTPNVVPAGAMILQPSNERRQSGSHYTPRSLTSPIVRRALAPVLAALGPDPSPEMILQLKICDPAAGSGAFLVEACRQLGDALVDSWRTHKCTPKIPADEDELLHARRIVAQRCIYGVDRNPMAVDLAKLSLWLATLAEDHPFTFIDHNVRCGDSLVGLSTEQIVHFHWSNEHTTSIDRAVIEKQLLRATDQRSQILTNEDDSAYSTLEQKLSQANKNLEIIRVIGNSLIAAFFRADKMKDRKLERERIFGHISNWLHETHSPKSIKDGLLKVAESTESYQTRLHQPVTELLKWLDSGQCPIRPFHWATEFPEVFSRENGGFDVIVGNPPFAGKNSLIKSNRDGYLDWLKTIHEKSHGNSDLVAHFFRRAFTLVRNGGTFGLIATNTIRQGDTRTTGLQWIRKNEATIYAARRRLQWPGDAAVVVSVVHLYKGHLQGPFDIDGRPVSKITSFLFHDGTDDSPEPLKQNENFSFIGSYVLGMGFTFDDTDKKGIANPTEEMRRLIVKDPRNAERIFPYIGGEEILHSPTQAHHRFVINFAEMEEAEARSWPDLMAIVEQRVKPERDKLEDNADGRRRKAYWWQWGRYTPSLFVSMKNRQRVLALSRVAQHLALAFQPTDRVFAETVVIFPFDSFAAFAVLQSRVHEIWARFFSSSLEDRLRYAPSDCFDSFSFPQDFETNVTLQRIGQEYYEYRAQLMVALNEGLTDLYNRFHDPDERSGDILHLRTLHDHLDQAVLASYGWADIETHHDFKLEYVEEDDDEQSAAPSSNRKKPWRYSWTDPVHDEILIRLLELNKTRAISDKAEERPKNSKGRRKKKNDETKSGKPDDRPHDLQLLLPGVGHD